MTLDQILERLQALARPENVAGMARFGITPAHTYGVSLPALRQLAREIGKNHTLATQLWEVDTRETRILASLVAVPKQVTLAHMEAWAGQFDYWEICDQVVSNLFYKTPFAYDQAVAWSEREETYVKRAGFVLMAQLAVKDKKASDEKLARFLPIIEREAGDPRDMVKKGSNWALRQIGKRNLALHQLAMATANQILAQNSKSGNWIARDALRELQSETIQTRLRQRIAPQPPANP